MALGLRAALLALLCLIGWMLTHHSRQALKKYVQANNQISVSDNMFDSLFNKALKAGVDKGVFEQPKGMLAPFALLLFMLTPSKDPRVAPSWPRRVLLLLRPRSLLLRSLLLPRRRPRR